MKKGFVGINGFGGTKACFDLGAATLEALRVGNDSNQRIGERITITEPIAAEKE